MNDATTGFTEVTFERSEWASAWIPLGVDLDSNARLEQALAWFDEHADELHWDHDGSEVEATGANIGPVEPTRGARPFSPCLGGAADREVAIIVDELRAGRWPCRRPQLMRAVADDPFARSLLVRAIRHESFDVGGRIADELCDIDAFVDACGGSEPYGPHRRSGATHELERTLRDWCSSHGLDASFLETTLRDLGRAAFASMALAYPESSGDWTLRQAEQWLDEKPSSWAVMPFANRVADVLSDRRKDGDATLPTDDAAEDVTTDDRLLDACWDLYRADWLLSHATHDEILDAIADYHDTIDENECSNLVEYLEEYGVSDSQIWVCRREFAEYEFKDVAYMERLLDGRPALLAAWRSAVSDVTAS